MLSTKPKPNLTKTFRDAMQTGSQTRTWTGTVVSANSVDGTCKIRTSGGRVQTCQVESGSVSYGAQVRVMRYPGSSLPVVSSTQVSSVVGISETIGVQMTGAVSVHDLAGAMHTGALASSQAPQFLMIDGSRALAGNLAVNSGITIDGIDISAHAADVNAHHSQAHVLSGTDHTASGLTAGWVLRASGATAFAWSAIADGDLPSTIVRTARTISVSGLGLSGGGDLSADRVVSLASSSDVGTTPTAAILASTSAGGITLASLAVKGSINVTSGGDLTVGANVLAVNNAGGRIGINRAADAQFDLDVNGSLRAGGYIVGKHALQLPGALMICHYDGPQPYATNFTGDSTGHMGQAAILAGGVIYRPGKFGKAVQIAEATTNRVKNPSGETNTTGYASDWVGSSIAQSTVYARYGSYSIKLTHGTSGGRNFYYYPGTTLLALSSPNTVSIYARRSDGVEVSGVTVLIDSGLATVTPAIVSVGDGWYRIIATRSMGASLTGLDLVGFNLPAVDVDWYFDGLQVEAKAYVTPYCDGSLGGYSALGPYTSTGVPDGTGHTWSGTAHASTSSRVVATVQYMNPIRKEAGTILLWWTPAIDSTTSLGWPSFFCYGVPAAYYQASDDKIYFTSGANTISTSALTFAAETPQLLAFSWSSAGIAIRRASGSTVDTTVTGATYTIPTAVGSYLCVGSDASGSNKANGLIDDLVVLDHALTDSEFLTIFYSNAPVFAETSTWGWRSANTLAWADDQGLWCLDASGNASFGVSGVDSKNWGGITLDRGDVLMGRSTAYAKWDASAGALEVKGSIKADSGYLASLDITGKLSMSGANSAIAIGATPPTSASAGTGIWVDRTGLYGLATNVVQAKFDAATGSIVAGGGNVILDVNGLALTAIDQDISSIRWTSSASTRAKIYCGEGNPSYLVLTVAGISALSSAASMIFYATEYGGDSAKQASMTLLSGSSRKLSIVGALTASAGLGVNGNAAQTKYASGGAAPAGGTGATAGAYDTAAHRDALITLVNNIRTALVNNGIMS